MGQINITRGSTPIATPLGKSGISIDTNGNIIVIDESGNYVVIGTGTGGSTNVIAELGVGIEADLPALGAVGESYVTTDTAKVFTVKDALSWDETDLEKGQFVVNTLSDIELYAFDGIILELLQALETAQTILDKIGDGSTISATYLPSYVDDVLEYANLAAFPVTGETSKIYLALDSSISYRWSGTIYVQITSTPTYASQAEAEAGVENTKVMTALRVAQSWAYQAANYVLSTLNTTSKTVIGAINELLLKFVGVYNDRGDFDASVNTFPTTGGSGTAGAILKGDCYRISVTGDAGGTPLLEGIVIRALINTPGQIASNWYVPSFGVGYDPEDVANKENIALDVSTTKYPSNAIVKAAVDLLQQEIDNLAAVEANPIYYLENTASDIIGYEQLVGAPLTLSGVTEPIVINNNTVLFDAYATNPGNPGVTTIPAGIWTMHAHVGFSSVTGDNYVHWDIYTRNLAGVETFLFRMSTDDIGSTDVIEHQIQAVQSEVILLDTDRLVVKVSAQTTGTSKTATLYYGGTLLFAFMQTPPLFNSDTASLAYVNSKLSAKKSINTGYVSGMVISINVDTTKFDISAGNMVMMDYTDPVNPVSSIVPYAGVTGVTPTYLATYNVTYVAVDVNGNVIQSSSPFTSVQRRTLCLVGAAIHSNKTNINTVNQIKAPIYYSTNQLHDLIKAIGSINLSGNEYFANGANLSLDKSAGVVFGLGINAADYTNPHELTIGAGTALTFRYRLQDGTEYTDTTLINPIQYDLAGVLTSVANNKFTIQRINLFQSGITRIQYGQKEYTSMDECLSLIAVDPFITEQNIAENAIFRAYLIIKKEVTDLSAGIIANTARFIPVDKFGNVIGSAGAALTSAAIIAALGYTPQDAANIVGTAGTIPKFTSVNAIGDSLMTDNGSKINVAGNFTTTGQAHSGYNLKTFTASATFNANEGTNQEMICTGDTTIGISNELPGVMIIDLPISGAGVSAITIGASLGTPYPNNDALAYTDGSQNTITIYTNSSGVKKYTISSITA